MAGAPCKLINATHCMQTIKATKQNTEITKRGRERERETGRRRRSRRRPIIHPPNQNVKEEPAPELFAFSTERETGNKFRQFSIPALPPPQRKTFIFV
ncbi:hypothetical protein GWI33_019420 [Rhynchophorus ferrugineus]|uniref:Uncharacterized protein n=1 Tax=Rhynchophorus ferrugineus TaxID=354439 RepID=A0A834HRG5_RHYFE|nr:hypothetical protein GWI33_019420 [Rhynchophorus ferrugineus]